MKSYLTRGLLGVISLLIFQTDNLKGQSCHFPLPCDEINRNTLTLDFDPITGLLVIKDIYPCRISDEDLVIYFCRRDCETSPTAAQILENCMNSPYWDQCEAYWEWAVDNNDTYNTLEEECCPAYIQWIEDCKEECGEITSLTKPEKCYDLEIRFWWNTGLMSDMDGPGDEVITDLDNGGSVPVSIVKNLNVPGVPISYCLQVRIKVGYDDFSCCEFQDIVCFDLG